MTQNFYPPKIAQAMRSVTAHQAIENSPTLGRLAELVKESNDRLKAIDFLIPEHLKPFTKAGPIEGDTWCLLVNGNAAAAKLRQITPLIQSHLLKLGWKVTAIRLKILIGKR